MSKTEQAARRWQAKMGRKSFATISVVRKHGPGNTASARAHRAYRLARLTKVAA